MLGPRFRARGSRFRAQGLLFGVRVSGVRCQGTGFRVEVFRVGDSIRTSFRVFGRFDRKAAN